MMWPKATVCILHGAGQGICHSKARKATINKGIKKKVNTTIDLILASVPVACAVAWHIAHCSTSGKCHYSASGNCHWLLQKSNINKGNKNKHSNQLVQQHWHWHQWHVPWLCTLLWLPKSVLQCFQKVGHCMLPESSIVALLESQTSRIALAAALSMVTLSMVGL